MTSPSTASLVPVAAIHDAVLTASQHDRLVDYAVSREDDFTVTRVLAIDDDAEPTVDRNIRRSLHLRGTHNVPDEVVARLREVVPVLAARLGQDPENCRRGTFEAEVTATTDGGFFTPHIDNGNPRVRNRSTSFVLFFGDEPRPFTGGELCVERDHDPDEGLYIFDAVTCGALGDARIAEVVEPVPNRLVAFASHRLHEVRPVSTASSAFRSSRFTVTGFVRDPAD